MLTKTVNHNTECKSKDHDKHLCYLTSQGFHISDADEFKSLINKPQFKCKHCGRHANSNENLCLPEILDIE
ncbi:MAG: hypothetical protein JXA96_06930 [Sedimentisphaerales bacterium]|nr:hypothetical protein [Sedimentisphaerales bacterium]